ncbi:APC family permease [Brevibacterium daeguense]|uniref:APC family permease n=1 Tax=Brevibacterium daeguense TaxID=909936 RepID=A0ABP8EKS1_9MICO|nr:APC family permease [Brevibacterium daeguense]
MNTQLSRSLGLSDAVIIGLGSMIGAGIFAALAPAAAEAGSWLFLGLALAALVAYCNATASAQLAAQYPTSGGTYAYARAQVSPWLGLVAGWGYVIGKTASTAAMALTFAAYAAPAGWQQPLAVAALIALTVVNSLGISRTAAMTRVIVIAVLAILTVFLVVIAAGGQFSLSSLWAPEAVGAAGAVGGPGAVGGAGDSGVPNGFDLLGVLQAAGILFFAFAGYARIATLGEEVKDPQRTIPRAIILALGITTTVYAVVAVAVMGVLGPVGLAQSQVPLADAVGSSAWAQALVRVGAALACLGALLGLVAGIGRTFFAMARDSRHFQFFAQVSRFGTPARAEFLVCAVAIVLVLLGDIRTAIGFSSFGVLIYYSITNITAFTQTAERRRYPRALQVLGVILCVVLAFTVSLEAVIVGAILFAVIGAVVLLLQRRG